MCAQRIPCVNLPRNAAAVMAPPSRPATFAMSAKLLRSCSAYSSVNGSGQASTGERREVHDHVRSIAACIVECVAQDQPTLSVGVENLDRLAGSAGDDVAGLDGAAVGHIFASRH